MNVEGWLARYAACTHAVCERFEVRAHPSIWGLRYCRGCGSLQLLEHGVIDPPWRPPVLVTLAQRGGAPAAPKPED